MNQDELSAELSEIIQARSLSCLPLAPKLDQAMASRLAGLATSAESIQPGLWNQLATELSLIHSFAIDPLSLSALFASGLDPQSRGHKRRQPIHAWALATLSWTRHADTDDHRAQRIGQSLEILLAAGVDVDALDAEGSSALAILAPSRSSFCSDLLLAGADCTLPICRAKTGRRHDDQIPAPLPIWVVLAKAILTFRYIEGLPRTSPAIKNFDCRRSHEQWDRAISLLRSQTNLDWASHGQALFAEAFESAWLHSVSPFPNNPLWAEELRSTATWIASQGASPSSLDFEGWPVIATSAAHGDIASVACLLKIGANIEATGPQGFTPLMAAAFNGRSEIVSMLLAAGARIDALDHDGKSALDLAIAHGGSKCSMVLEILELEALLPKSSPAPRRRNAL